MGYAVGLVAVSLLVWRAVRTIAAAERNRFQRTEEREWWV